LNHPNILQNSPRRRHPTRRRCFRKPSQVW
jgi:hypothetical protein